MQKPSKFEQNFEFLSFKKHGTYIKHPYMNSICTKFECENHTNSVKILICFNFEKPETYVSANLLMVSSNTLPQSVPHLQPVKTAPPFKG